jgi:hypothetical protein
MVLCKNPANFWAAPQRTHGKGLEGPDQNAFLFFEKIHLPDFSAALLSRSLRWLYFAT